MKLVGDARLVLTDSGGIQEETTVLGVPCLTLRNNTERPVTVEQGTNVLVGLDPDRIIDAGLGAVRHRRGHAACPNSGTAERRCASSTSCWPETPEMLTLIREDLRRKALWLYESDRSGPPS